MICAAKKGIMPKRQIRIIATIGPASFKPAVLKRLMHAGMDVVRLNFSHGTPENHSGIIRAARRAFREAGKPTHIFADLPGPKIRLGIFEKEPVFLRAGHKLRLTVRNVPGTRNLLPVQYPRLNDTIRKGGLIFLADGLIQLRVLAVPRKGDALCEVLVGGELYSRKGINFPGERTWLEAITDQDLEWMRFGLAEGLDTFGLSFVERQEDVAKLRSYAQKLGKRIRIIAKIERKEALNNFPSLLSAANGIMVARGDLGLQLPLEEVPFIQKELIHHCNQARKTVITATQMMESMVHSFRPARSDVADVANAVLDGTDAVMLSEETAIGDYPVETVEWTARVCAAAESRVSGKRKKPLGWMQ